MNSSLKNIIISKIAALKIVSLTLGLIGCLTVLSATISFGGDINFAARQFLWLIIGSVIMELISRTDFDKIKFFLRMLNPVAILLLWLVLVFGVEINGMKGWFRLGNYFIQPSELAKPFFIFYICCFFTEKKLSEPVVFIRIITVLFIYILPLIFEPDYGTALVYLLTLMALLFIVFRKSLYFFSFSSVLFASFAAVALCKPYVLRRIYAFVNPLEDPSGAGWHILQFKYTIARGGLSGSGWGNCLWANSYLPLPHSDSAFATIAEASGFFGAFPIILIFSILPFIALRFASEQDDNSRALFILISFFTPTVQGLLHIMVNIGLFPPTGLTLPLLSYGGSSLISTMIIAGLICSAAKQEHSE